MPAGIIPPPKYPHNFIQGVLLIRLHTHSLHCSQLYQLSIPCSILCRENETRNATTPTRALKKSRVCHPSLISRLSGGLSPWSSIFFTVFLIQSSVGGADAWVEFASCKTCSIRSILARVLYFKQQKPRRPGNQAVMELVESQTATNYKASHLNASTEIVSSSPDIFPVNPAQQPMMLVLALAQQLMCQY